MKAAAKAEEFEQAALERNRLRAVKSLLERQRVANESVGTLDAIAIAVDGTDANAQVFQIRDGVLSDRQSFYLSNETGRDQGEVAVEFILQYYDATMAIPAQVIVQLDVPDTEALGEALATRRGAKVEVRAAERGDKRRILELAERNAQLALDQERLKDERRRQQRVEALDGLQRVLELDALPLRIECFDISNLMGTNTVASMVVFEAGAPKKSDYRRFNIRSTQEGTPDDFLAMEEVLIAQAGALGVRAGPQPERPEAQRVLRDAAEPDRHRRRAGPAVGRHARAARLHRQGRDGHQPRQAHRGGLHPRPPRAARARARHARAAAPAARARRGAPLRDHPPPHPPRPPDDRVGARRPARRRAEAQARAAEALRLARLGARRLARGARGGARDAVEDRARRLRLPNRTSG